MLRATFPDVVRERGSSQRHGSQKPSYHGDEGALEVQSSSEGKGKTLLDNDVIIAIYGFRDLCAYTALY